MSSDFDARDLEAWVDTILEETVDSVDDTRNYGAVADRFPREEIVGYMCYSLQRIHEEPGLLNLAKSPDGLAFILTRMYFRGRIEGV